MRVRRLMSIFSSLRHIADPRLLKLVYFTLCQSILIYCIASWGGTFKTYLLPLERAQRAILKVATFRKKRYSTTELYQNCGVLTVRKLFIFNTILRTHKRVFLNPLSLNKPCSSRRSSNIFSTCSYKTFFVHRFQCYLAGFLYNLANKLHFIYKCNSFEAKSVLIKWLFSLDYDETEKLLSSPLRG